MNMCFDKLGRNVYNSYGTTGDINNVLGRISSIDAASGGSTPLAEYTYMGAGTIIKVEHPQVSGGLNLSYGESATQPTSSYPGFDNLGRVVDQLWENDAQTTTHDQFKYGYDGSSNRTWKENAITHATPALPQLDEFYTYDDLNRLINTDRGTLSGTHPDYSAPASPTFEQDWQLNPTGNWNNFIEKASGTTTLDQAREHNLVNEIGDITEQPGDPVWLTPAHDSAGNMILAPRPSGPNQPTNAESIATEGLILTYDAWNRLRKIHKNDATTTTTIGIGSTSITTADPTLIAEYEYDGINRRIRKILYTEEKLKDEKTGEVTLTTVEDYHLDYYYNTAWQVLEIRKDDDVDPLKQYVWDIRYIDSPVLRWHDANEDGDFDDSAEVHYYTTDANMNITALVDPSDGLVVERYAYDPYGKCTILNGDVAADPDGITDPTTYPEWSADLDNTSDVDNEILYTGYRYDPESGLYQVRHRYLHSTVGRWTTQDHWQGYIDGMSLYEYVGSQPIMAADPYGLWKIYLKPDPSTVLIEDGDTLWTIAKELTGKGANWKLLFSADDRARHTTIKGGEKLQLAKWPSGFLAWSKERWEKHVIDIPWTEPNAPATEDTSTQPPASDKEPPASDKEPPASDKEKSPVMNAPKAYEGFVTTSATAHGVPAGILKGLIKAESSWKPSARSGAGAVGLTQILIGTAKDLGMTVNAKTDDRLDPKKSIDGGAKYLKIQYDHLYEGKTILEQWRLALGAYNWGRGNINKKLKTIGKLGKRGTANWCEIAPKVPKETRDYVKKILGQSGDASGYAKEYGYAK